MLNAAYEKCESNLSAEHESSRLSPSCRFFCSIRIFHLFLNEESLSDHHGMSLPEAH